MPSTYTGVASALTARTALGAAVPIGTDPPNAALTATPLQTILDKIASMLLHGGLLDVAGTWTALQTFSAGISVSAAITYAAGSAAFRTGFRKMGYWQDAHGAVHVEGVLTSAISTTANAVTTLWAAGTIPSGLCPLADVHVPCLAFDSSNNNPGLTGGGDAVYSATVGSDGSLKVKTGTAGGTGTIAYVEISACYRPDAALA